MTDIITRAEWGARPPNGAGNALGNPKGVTVHYEGPKMGRRDHSKCDALVRSIQRFHQVTRGWSDVAYNLMVCEHGYVYEGRGAHRGNAANGSTASNLSRFSVCALVGKGDTITDNLKHGLCDAIVYLRNEGDAGTIVDCHSDHFSTACPGDELRAWVRAGTPRPGGSAPAAPPASALPNLPKPASKPKPKPSSAKAPRFPLPSGWYFGPKSGPKYSVSGYYGHRSDLKRWQDRMHDRGWDIGVDGLYGPETAKIAKQFQREKHLTVDGLIGAATWAAAWTATVT